MSCPGPTSTILDDRSPATPSHRAFQSRRTRTFPEGSGIRTYVA